MTVRVLTVAESDSVGARGVQADVKTVLAFGGYASTAISAIIAQDTKSVDEINIIDAKFVAKQMRLAIESIGVDVIKIGMLANEEIINAVSSVLDEYKDLKIPVVVDPELVDIHGNVFLSGDAIGALKRRIFLYTTVLTPSLQEAEILSGRKIRDIDDMRAEAEMLRTIGIENIVLKAGQVISKKSLYFVSTMEEERIYEHAYINSKNVVGAGATLSAAIATSLAQGMEIFEAVERSIDFVNYAIKKSSGFDVEYGPIDHGFAIERYDIDKIKDKSLQVHES